MLITPMHSKCKRFISTWVAVGLVFSLANFVFPLQRAKADSNPVPTLIINEINWAGSISQPDDEWIELRNVQGVPINLSADDYYELYANETLLARIDSGSIDNYFLIGKAASPSLNVAPAQTLLAGLPNIDVQYSLKHISAGAATLVDQAGLSSGAPLAGADGTVGDKVIASMSRKNNLPAWQDGTLLSSWYTAHTIGANFKTGVEAYGTPAANNLEVAIPQELAINPATSATVDLLNVTVSGKALSSEVSGSEVSPAKSAAVRWEKYEIVPSSPLTMDSGLASGVQVDGSFSDLTPLPNQGGIYEIGMYKVSVSTSDLSGNRSAFVQISIPDSPQNLYTVNEAPVTLHAPVLIPQPGCDYTLEGGCVLNPGSSQSVTINGKTDIGTTLIVAINGKDAGITSDIQSQGDFSVDVALEKNALNKIEVRAMKGTEISLPAIAYVIHDDTAPVVDVNLLKLNANPGGINDSMLGLPGAVSDAAKNPVITLYSDQFLTNKIGEAVVAGDGSFAEISLGDNVNARVYLVVKDIAGNVTQVFVFDNPIRFANERLAIPIYFANIGQDQATVRWEPVSGAVNYRLKYKNAGGNYSNPIDLCLGPVSTCGLERTIINLGADTEYVIAIAAVDQAGNESIYSEQSFRTLVPPPPVVTPTVDAPPAATTTAAPSEEKVSTQLAEAVTTQAVTEDTSVRSLPTPPTPEPTKTAEPEALPQAEQVSESGEVKSAEESDSRNWTPWIILAVLIGLAVLATTGYFYWFGGEAGELALASVIKERERNLEEDGLSEVGSKEKRKESEEIIASKKDVSPPKRSSNKDKRW